MNKLRVSFSILKLWQQGRVEDMVNSYFKLAEVTNPYMEQGKLWDEKVNEQMLKNNALLPEFGGDVLLAPKVQEKWEVDFQNYRLVGIPDIVSVDTLYEIKTGNSKDSGDYATDFQVGIYLFMGELMEKELSKALILHYNQYTKELDKTLIWNTPFERSRAKNYIESLAPEILSFFQDNHLFEKYGIDKAVTNRLI